MQSWNRLKRWPGGAWLFSRRLGMLVPYSGSIHAQVCELGPGHARLTLRERRAIRQHLGSIHAVALINLGELTSGLAMLSALPAGARAIVLGLSAEYFKKARGTLTAESSVAPPAVTGPVDLEVFADIKNAEGDVVCRVTARWRLDRDL